MRIINHETFREIIADEGKLLLKNGLYFKKCIMLPGDTEEDYIEVDENDIIEN